MLTCLEGITGFRSTVYKVLLSFYGEDAGGVFSLRLVLYSGLYKRLGLYCSLENECEDDGIEPDFNEKLKCAVYLCLVRVWSIVGCEGL